MRTGGRRAYFDAKVLSLKKGTKKSRSDLSSGQEAKGPLPGNFSTEKNRLRVNPKKGGASAGGRRLGEGRETKGLFLCRTGAAPRGRRPRRSGERESFSSSRRKKAPHRKPAVGEGKNRDSPGQSGRGGEGTAGGNEQLLLVQRGGGILLQGKGRGNEPQGGAGLRKRILGLAFGASLSGPTGRALTLLKRDFKAVEKKVPYLLPWKGLPSRLSGLQKKKE